MDNIETPSRRVILLYVFECFRSLLFYVKSYIIKSYVWGIAGVGAHELCLAAVILGTLDE